MNTDIWSGWTAKDFVHDLDCYTGEYGKETILFDAVTDFFIAYCDEGKLDKGKLIHWADCNNARLEISYEYIQECSDYFNFGSKKLINRLNHIIHTSDGEKAELAQSLLDSLNKFANTEEQTRLREKIISSYKELGEKIPK